MEKPLRKLKINIHKKTSQGCQKLLMHEIHLKEDEEKETQFKKGVAFKTGSEDVISSEEDSSEEDEDTTATIVKELKKMFKSKKFDSRSSTKRDRYQAKWRSSQKV